MHSQYWITALSKRQRRQTVPPDPVSDEAMGCSFGQEKPSTKKGKQTLMRESAVSLQRQAHSHSSQGSYRERRQQDRMSAFGCVGGGLGQAPKAACLTDTLWSILRLIFLWSLLKGDVFFYDLPSSGLCLYKHFGWRKQHCQWTLCMLWVHCGFFFVFFFHLGYC